MHQSEKEYKYIQIIIIDRPHANWKKAFRKAIARYFNDQFLFCGIIIPAFWPPIASSAQRFEDNPEGTLAVEHLAYRFAIPATIPWTDPLTI